MTIALFLAPLTAFALAAAPPADTTAQSPTAAATAAQAEALGACLVAKTTGEDRLAVARWLIAGLASAPQVADVVSVRSGAKPIVDKRMATLFTRLLAVDCATLSRPLFAAGGSEGFRLAGEALGRIAVQELLGNPAAAAALGTYSDYLKKEDFNAVLK